MLITLIKKLNPKPSTLNPKNGQMMIEALVALSIILVGLLGIFALVSRSISLNMIASSQYVAVNLAAEGIEVVKNMIDGNVLQKNPWNQGISAGDYQMDSSSIELTPYSGEKLRFDEASGLYGYSDGALTNFRRKLNISLISADEIKIVSSVDWTTRDGASFNIDLEDHFFNWRQ